MNEYIYEEGFVPFAEDIINFNVEKAVEDVGFSEEHISNEYDVRYLLNAAVCSINSMSKMCAMVYMQCMQKLGVSFDLIEEGSLFEEENK